MRPRYRGWGFLAIGQHRAVLANLRRAQDAAYLLAPWCIALNRDDPKEWKIAAHMRSMKHDDEALDLWTDQRSKMPPQFRDL
jgi:hypothetical protein